MDVLEFLVKNPRFESILRHAVDWEEDPKNADFELGWEPLQVHASRRDVEELVYAEIARLTMHSAHFAHFRLADREAVKASLEKFKEWKLEAEKEEAFVIPEDLFDDVVGYDDLKQLFLKALQGERVHFLLLGPPSSAKTLFLLCLEKLPKARYILGSRMSKAGLTDFLITQKPKIVLLDEVDKMDGEDYGVLLSLCETGRVTEMLYGRVRQAFLDTVVFGCTNTLKGIPPEVISRFEVLRFRPYNEIEFRDVVENVLVRRGLEKDTAAYIASKVWHDMGSRDPREAIRISKMAKTKEEADRIISWIKKYR
jgi:Holliday junction DNA helicase RuvB